MINKCEKCNSTDLVDVNGVIMCNNCGEILNSDTKQEISIKIDGVNIEDNEGEHHHLHCSCEHCHDHNHENEQCTKDHAELTSNDFMDEKEISLLEEDLSLQDITEIDPKYWDVFDIDRNYEDELDLNLEGYDKLATLNDLLESDEKSINDPEDIMNREGQWCYIDDLSDLSEDLSYDDYNNAYEEKYPGLLIHKEK